MPLEIVLPSLANIKRAVRDLREGHLIAIPTETVYGLAADATNDQAVARVFALKQRPTFNPLIIHFAYLHLLEQHVVFDARAYKLAKVFWPGPLTLVLPRKPQSTISLLASAGLDTLAVRMPDHLVARKILKLFKEPLAAPSANPSGQMSPSCSEHVFTGFKGTVEPTLILEGGPCLRGLESTIVSLVTNRPVILRPGVITREEIEQVIGFVQMGQDEQGKILSPGQLRKHYAPHQPIRLNATTVDADEALLAFGSQVPQGAAKTLNLSLKGDLVEAAAHLFLMLHELDQPHFRCIAVMSIPMQGIGCAINDRLQRAASP